MEIKTGKAAAEPEAPAVEVPPDRSRPSRKKAAQKLQRNKPLGARLLAVFKVMALLSFVALAIVTGLSCYRYVNSSGLLTLRNVTVLGCKYSDPGAVDQIVRQNGAVNVLRIDLKGLGSRLEQEPWIRRVELRRILPASLEIMVEERVPSVIAEIGGELQLLDQEGYLLDRNDPKYGRMDVPVFSGLRGEDAASYRQLQEENSARVRTGVQVLTELASGSPEFTRALSEVDLSDPANVKVMLVDDTAEVLLGDRDFLKRFRMFASNRQQYQEMKDQGQEIAAIDLRFESQIVYRLRRPATEQAEAKGKAKGNQ
jgi:cell division protein FtsQ